MAARLKLDEFSESLVELSCGLQQQISYTHPLQMFLKYLVAFPVSQFAPNSINEPLFRVDDRI